MATLNLSHNNWLQWGAITATSTADFIYNTGYQNTRSGNSLAGEGPQFYANSSGTLGATNLTNNVVVTALETGNVTMSYIMHGGTVSSGTNANNYFDSSGAFGPYYPSSFTGGAGWTNTTNYNMLSGAVITP